MCQNTACIVAIELLAAAQGLDFRLPLKTSTHLQEVHAAIRELAATYTMDRAFDLDIEAVKTYLLGRDWIPF
jgi:histidine ammonia-lyase